MTNKEEFRKSVKDTLELLSSKEQQLEYEKNVPIANVPAELYCMWFDDLYHPDTELFNSSFEKEELERLEAFNNFYENRIGRVPDTTLMELHNNEEWNEVVAEAKKVLDEISW